MRLFPKSLNLSENVFLLLRDLIHERTGVNYEDSKRDILAEKLLPRVSERGLESFLDYYYLLKYDTSASEEWKHVMDAIAVPETYFWREIDQIHALVNIIVPKYFKKHSEPLRIWSAACSTGEEPLSIAIALNEQNWFWKAPIEIYASDASRSAIAKACSGLYRERSFRALPPNIKEKYFHKENEAWRIAPEIHARIKWQTANLLDESEVRPLAKATVIFCRNVFIYFSEKTIRKTVNLFWECMPNPGYLFLGSSESLLKLNTEFELEEINGSFVYVKNKR
ncbi:MAG: protein-glutamate O-methyltransferase CheR [Oscillatoriaceae bacterium SKW80]|nr:protein-glutamate O-methyltransferase CheR [Oscillatoriaceae bacterium SKYG93]MCX8120010.1 protein-glutamate O-methyltransferase CheR [Oscillatoriaceae bacterium SKW80]MDW8454017.1 protein-glutamate O-methyltransferase CheR [Oscillatoriaceae cyanobacterium SKYGB_i_bin93]HIK29678.1 protein-glutamate O-methyltransferase CheR [Oscillatoriaceae cyanobacterium M7585_C2015_266]